MVAKPSKKGKRSSDQQERPIKEQLHVEDRYWWPPIGREVKDDSKHHPEEPRKIGISEENWEAYPLTEILKYLARLLEWRPF
jgi:hypothetical protein